MNFFEKKLNGETVYSGKIIKVDVDSVELPDKSIAKRECVRHNGGAAILFVENERVLLVKQFRYAYGQEIYEIPAGKLEVGEPPEITAKRELEEEAGLIAGKLVHYLTLYPTPGYTDEKIYIYLAENCKKTDPHLDEGEFLNCEFIEISKVLDMIDRGEICDGKTIAAVYKYLINKNKAFAY